MNILPCPLPFNEGKEGEIGKKKNHHDRWCFLTFLLPNLGKKRILRILTWVFNYDLHHSKA